VAVSARRSFQSATPPEYSGRTTSSSEIITNQFGANRALACPAYLLGPFLPPPVVIRSEQDVARCEAEERGRRVGRQPFTVATGVRCESMGDVKPDLDSESGFVCVSG